MATPWQPLLDRASTLATRLTRLTPDQAEAVRRVVEALSGVHGTLAAMESAVAGLPEADRSPWQAAQEALAQRYYALAFPIYRTSDAVGAGPLLVVGGLALSAVACAWALVAYEYVADLQAQTELAATELAARVEAMRTDKQLPASTVGPTAAGPSARQLAMGVVGLSLLGAAWVAFRRAA